ncbi:MAG: tetratricopeptide repeat protein [Betaproteobacteria bacterium]|nr:MAG: tetratricopeptide repeat protein [Betaproteobacteria bacterium]
MLGPHSQLPIRAAALRLLAAMAIVVVVFAGCAATAPRQAAVGEEAQDESDADASAGEAQALAPEPADRTALPNQELTENLLYEFLLAEIAGQRGNAALSAQAYVDLAKRTRDPRIARRATEVALYARMNNAAIESATIWHETEPGSRPLQALAGLLVAAGRYDEALPNLRKLLAGSANEPANGFTQLTRTLANAQDKQAALKLVHSLAADYPKLAESHLAVARAAVNAGDERLALEEARKAGQLRPDWEAPALLEAQLLQKSSVDQAASFLTAYLKRYPAARETRLAYARLLVAQKRFGEARAEFQKLMAGAPDGTEVAFAVALLSLQLKDYDAAEKYLRGLIESPYRDKDGVRLYLGQVAEERKNLPEALRWYAEVGEGEQYVQAQIRYAQVLAKQGKLDEARGRLQDAAAKDGQQRVQLVLAEAQLLRDANQPKTAFDLVGQALDRVPNNPELLYDYAMLAEKLERVDILEASLRKLIEIRPEHAHAYNALGYSLADRNQRLPEARELIEKALQLAPEDSFIIDSMGWVLYRMGKLKDSLGYLRRAFAGRPDPEIAAHLGEVLWAMGERAEAERVWGDATRESPDNETLANTIKRLKH